MTKKFNNLKFATEDLSKSHKKTAALKIERDQAIVNQLFGTGTAQQTDEAEEDYQTSQQKTARNLSTVIDAENEKGVEQKGLKGVFSKLSGLGEFLNKKAVPIGIGMGVAGILVSIIVKSFSASPLFAQMMKMMKFMVTLILMPIGTFFGALLRPIMIMLLRKLIVPMFSKWMPLMMTAGTQVGTILAKIADSWLFGGGSDKSITDGTSETEERSYMGGGNPAITFLRDMMYAVEKLFEKKEDEVDEDISTPTPAFGGGTLSGSIGGTGVDDGNFFGVDNSIPDAGHSKASDYDFDVNDVLKTADDEVLKAIQLGDYHEGERARIALEEEKRLAAEEAARQQVIKDEEERLAKVAENKTNYDESTPERKRIADAQQAAKDANEKRAADNAAAISGEAPAYVPTYAEERQAEWDNMGGFSREDGGVNNQRAIEEDIAKRKQEKLDIAEETRFLAGESGAEHVKVTPSGSGGGSNITVNIQNMNGSDNDLRKLKKTILEVIQQSSANRGRL